MPRIDAGAQEFVSFGVPRFYIGRAAFASALLGSFFGALLLGMCFVSPAEAQRGRTGTLIFEVDQDGAEVFVDGDSVGISPIAPIELERGEHTVRVSKPGFTEFTSVVEITARREHTVVADLFPISMALMVLVEPTGARVFVDGSFMGEAPVEVELNDGDHELRVEARGFYELTERVTAIAGSDDVLQLELEPLPLEVRQALLEEQEPGFFEEPLSWVGIGAAAVAVTVGVILLVVLLSPSDSAQDEFCAASMSNQCYVTMIPGL